MNRLKKIVAHRLRFTHLFGWVNRLSASSDYCIECYCQFIETSTRKRLKCAMTSDRVATANYMSKRLTILNSDRKWAAVAGGDPKRACTVCLAISEECVDEPIGDFE